VKNILRQLHFSLAYLSNPRWETGISPPELLDFIRSHSPGRALDLGCGTGTNSIKLAKHGWQVIGVDFVGRAIRKARWKARQASVQVDFQQDDVTSLSKVRGAFDLVLDIGCFHSLPDKQKMTYSANLTRILTPGGTFMIYAILREPGTPLPGCTQADFVLLSQQLKLVLRNNGTERGKRPSAWLWFMK
jgi:2-polyprenyl-3-methyl-5-hydroxy-6-metoxy-1,4-benzoquinol methylase